MEQTFYVNVLFGKNKEKIFNAISEKVLFKDKFLFQVHPYRINQITELNENRSNGEKNFEILKHQIKQHVDIINDINSSSLKKNFKPFENIIFVNYTTEELEPALKFNRIQYYLCDFINDENIEILVMSNFLFYINFMKKAKRSKLTSINKYFMNYTTLACHDTDADRRIGNTTSLDIGEETEDDTTFILRTRLKNTHIYDSDDESKEKSIILPYHPFRHTIFVSIQNVKDNLNALLLSKNTHLMYYPFSQSEWLLILQNIMYEHVFLNFLVSESLYNHEPITVQKFLHRNNIAYNYRFFKKLQRKHKTHILNEIVFNYKDAFKVIVNNFNSWYNKETKFLNTSQSPQFYVDIFCIRTNNGIFI